MSVTLVVVFGYRTLFSVAAEAITMAATGAAYEALGAPSAPLAVESGIAYAESMVAMTPGDTLVLFTDGLVERRGEPIDRGLAALSEVLRRDNLHPTRLDVALIDNAADAAIVVNMRVTVDHC